MNPSTPSMTSQPALPVLDGVVASTAPAKIEPSAADGHPARRVERAFRAKGAQRVAGVDEVGRGALAGPVTAAAVVLPWWEVVPEDFAPVRDSKQLAPAARASLAGVIRARALAVAVGHVWPQEIDALGIARATAHAMRRALLGLPQRPDVVLVDGLPPAGAALPAGIQHAIVRGDRSELAIAAASVVAKAARDAWMVGLSARRPDYGHDAHKGYAAPHHLRAIALRGATPEHRLSWRTFAGPRQAHLPGWQDRGRR